MSIVCKKVFMGLLSMVFTAQLCATPTVEKLNRGMVAVKTTVGVFISWRFFATDTEDTAFLLYRDGELVQETPYATVTNCVDRKGTLTSTYTLQTLVDNCVTETYGPISVLSKNYLTIPIKRPEGGTTLPYTAKNSTTESYPNGQAYTYVPEDCSIGDVDGDGEYEFILKWNPTNARDNSQRGYTGKVFFDCYKLDGTQLWRIDLGINIRAGAHYTQFMVYDFDGDGKAEMACKTAPGTIDGAGNPVLMGTDNYDADYRTHNNAQLVGMIMSGPEYLTMFNGETGAAITTVAYVPSRTVTSNWGDNKANRCDRFVACVAYLNGVTPSLVMCRGYYTNAYLCAWDFKDSKLTQRWFHKSETKGAGAYNEGAHGISVADVDGDGCDEIIYGACAIDHDGTLLYRTGWGHGDALHVGDLDPDIDGLEVFMPHENTTGAYGYEMHSARTGKFLWGAFTGNDVGRGMAADIDSKTRGVECYSPGSSYLFDCKGNVLSSSHPSPVNFRLYWDGDLYEELLDYNTITKWNGTSTNLTGSASDNTKPHLSGDILGDWREEVILHNATTCSELYIHTTTAVSPYRMPTLVHDHIYRMGMAWQNTVYNQPPHLGYYLPDQFTATLTPTETSGATIQTIELGDSILPIVFTYTKATGAYCTGISTYGLTFTVNEQEKTVTLSGTPSKTGISNYTIKTTGNNINASETGKIYINAYTDISSLTHTEEATVYDLSGKRVLRPQNGIYIIHGKKTFLRSPK